MNVFDCAIKIEKEACKFYQKMEAESSNTELKTLFSLLAAEEQEHLRTLAEMKKNLDPEAGDFQVHESDACTFRPVQGEKDLAAVMNTDRDFYLHAVREEEQDIRFYEDLASRTKDEDVRRKLLMVAEEERRHLNRLENIYSFVEEPRTYLAWREFSNLNEL